MTEIKSPLSVSLQITGLCNLQCKYCYAKTIPKTHMQLSEFKLLISQFANLGVFEIVIEGGEPFLHPEIFDILEYGLTYYPNLVVLTNGSIINNDICKNLVTLQRKFQAFGIQISLDSPFPVINDFVRGNTIDTINGIDKLCTYGIQPTIATVIHKHNLKSAEKIIDYYYPRIKNFHFMNLMPSKAALEDQNVLFIKNQDELNDFWLKLTIKKEKYKDIILSLPTDELTLNSNLGTGSLKAAGCLAGITRITIGPTLDVYPCSLVNDIILGNLKKTSFKEIWQSEYTERIRESTTALCCKDFINKIT